MITTAEIEKYDQLGAVTIDTPFTDDELNAAEAAWDRWHATGTPWLEERDFINVVQHPFFEQVSNKVLRTDEAQLSWGVLPHRRVPAEAPHDPTAKQWREASHIDFQSTTVSVDRRRSNASHWS